MEDLNNQLTELKIEKNELEISHLKKPWFKDIKFLLPTIISLFLAYLTYSEWSYKQMVNDKLSKSGKAFSSVNRNIIIEHKDSLSMINTTNNASSESGQAFSGVSGNVTIQNRGTND